MTADLWKSHITREAAPSRLPIAKAFRIAVIGVAGILILMAATEAQAVAAVSGAAGAAIAWAVVTWRQAPIVKAAKKLAHAFALTDSPCINETRALSRAVFLAKE